MKNKRGILLMGVGLLLLFGAGALTYFNHKEEDQAAVYSASAAAALREQIPNYIGLNERLTAESLGLNTTLITQPSVSGMYTLPIEGYAYIGMLDIPVLGISLPIMQNWSYPNLRHAPCRYKGSVLGHNMIIAGHNYPSHFGTLYQLDLGDTVWFTDVLGNAYAYRVDAIETLTRTDVKRMESGDWDLTLFTCTVGGTNRVTIRCKQQ